jgi:hypothetical protein
MILLCASLPTALLIVIFAMRCEGTVRRGQLFDPTGFQGPSIYGVWRVQEGYSLYEWPNREHYTLTFYNYLFYYSYAWLLKLAAVRGEAIVTSGRLLTAMFGAAGAVVTFFIARTISGWQGRWAAWFTAAMAFCTWFAFTPVGWWILSVRPDVLALVFATSGLAVYVTADRHDASPALYLGGSLLFYLAWATKQSTVALFVAVCIHCLLARAPRRAAYVAVPMTLLVVATLLIGGAAYRYNIIGAASLSRIRFDPQALYNFRNVLIGNAFLWLYGPAMLAVVRFGDVAAPEMRSRGPHRPPDGSPGLGLLITACCVTLPWNLLTTFREGGTDNGMLEAHLCFSLLSVVVLLRYVCANGLSPIVTCLVGYLLLAMTYLPAETLFWHTGDLRVATVAQWDERRAAANYVRRLPQPVLVGDRHTLNEMLTLPWYTTGNRYGAFVPDGFWQGIAIREGELRWDFAEELVRKRSFRSLFVARSGPWQRLIGPALQSGYAAPPRAAARVPRGYATLVLPRNAARFEAIEEPLQDTGRGRE